MFFGYNLKIVDPLMLKMSCLLDQIIRELPQHFRSYVTPWRDTKPSRLYSLLVESSKGIQSLQNEFV